MVHRRGLNLVTLNQGRTEEPKVEAGEIAKLNVNTLLRSCLKLGHSRENTGIKSRDFSYCLLIKGVPLYSGFTVML